MNVLPALSFGSCFGYSPNGVCVVSRHSRLVCSRVKASDTGQLERYAAAVARECAPGRRLALLFADNPTLVPVPGCVPDNAGGTSAAGQLSFALLRQGLGAAVWPGVIRISAVRKSATAQAGARPSVEDHYRSFGIDADMPRTDRILIVDDVVTKGRTLLAAATRLREAVPDAHITGFALLRTLSLTAEINSLLQPCAGEIRWRRGDARRIP